MKKNLNSKVCHIANKLVAQGHSRSAAMIRAWILVKAPLVESKVAGVTVGRRQEAIEHLTRYDAERISITLRREAGNRYDINAIAVVAAVEGKGEYTVGYVPRSLAAARAAHGRGKSRARRVPGSAR